MFLHRFGILFIRYAGNEGQVIVMWETVIYAVLSVLYCSFSANVVGILCMQKMYILCAVYKLHNAVLVRVVW